jgi:hypothetical protein
MPTARRTAREIRKCLSDAARALKMTAWEHKLPALNEIARLFGLAAETVKRRGLLVCYPPVGRQALAEALYRFGRLELPGDLLELRAQVSEMIQPAIDAALRECWRCRV